MARAGQSPLLVIAKRNNSGVSKEGMDLKGYCRGRRRGGEGPLRWEDFLTLVHPGVPEGKRVFLFIDRSTEGKEGQV